MALSAPTDLKNFRFILSNLLSANNEARTKAEAQYDAVAGHERIFLLLSTLCDDTVPPEEAELAAVLLRRLITSEFEQVFSKLPPDIQSQIKSQLLLRIQQNINHNLRRKISDVAAELARNCIDDDGNNHWPDFLKYLFESAQSPDPVLREIALLMFSSVPGVFGNQQSRYIDVIHQMLTLSLSDQQAEQVRYVAVKATSAFILANEKEIQVQKQFTDCLSLLLQFFGQVLDSKDGQPNEILRHLVDLVEVCPQFFRGQLDILFQLCIKGLSNPDYLESCRHLSLEVIVTLCEAAPAMVKKLGSKHIPTLMTFVLKMMTDIEDDSNWDFVDDESADDDNDCDPVFAEGSLDRIACALGGKTVLPIVLNTLPQMLNSSIWKERYAGLMTISAIGEGCHKQMAAMLPHTVEGILPFLIDAHTRVRYAACNALGQMSTDFAPVFQKKFHERVIPGLLQVLSDSSSPRVQAHAGAALVNFFEDCPKSILTPYMDGIIVTLESVLNLVLKEQIQCQEFLPGNCLTLYNLPKNKTLVLEQVVVTLASLADTAQDKFTDYYERFMPLLKNIIQYAVQPELRMLRGKVIECVSLIGLAVGREKFLSDASEVMDLLLKTQSADAPIADDDPQLSYMIAAWARICKILGKAFKPYLPFVMKPVLKAADLRPEIAVLDVDDMKTMENDDNWEFINMSEKHNFGIRTAGIDEKATACQMLVCYARELKDGFVDYIEDTLKVMAPMLKFYFHDGVRIAAGEILPCLLECGKVRGEEYVQLMWQFILPLLVSALDAEPECEVLCEHMAAFAQCIEILDRPCLDPENFSLLIDILNKNFVAHFEKTDAREKKRKEEDYDEELEESLLEEDDEDVYLLSKISAIISTLFSVYKQDFCVYFDMMLPHIIRLIEPSRPWADRQWSLCMFADVIEFSGPACSRYQQYFLQPILLGVSDERADLRQTATYSLGVLSEFGGPEFAKFCIDSLPLLIQVINDPNSRSEENGMATDNAISAVTKIIMFHAELISLEELLPVWISWLPVWEDTVEAVVIYNFLCTLLETNNPILLGKENCNLPKVVQIIAEAFYKEAINPASETGKRIITLLRHIQSNGELFSVCVSQLSPNQQQALHKALTDQ